MYKVITDYGSFDSSTAPVKVYVRLRPPERDPHRTAWFLHANGKTHIEIRDPNPSKQHQVVFSFNRVFWTDTTQSEIFETVVKPQVDHVLSGMNACCFAYGQTGSGKTHSMFGPSFEERGIVPRAAEHIFSSLMETENTVAIGCSFLEIYNGLIRDLAKNYVISKENPDAVLPKETTSQLYHNIEVKRQDRFLAPDSLAFAELQTKKESVHHDIQDDGKGNVTVKDLTTVSVTSAEEIMDIINFGLSLRATHETKMNSHSSRSHTVFSIHIAQTLKKTKETIFGILNLVDLAGNEKLKQSESTDIRLKEALHINSSLTALGKVIMSLDPNAKIGHIPYRDSKLTRILQNSLSGNSYTVVLANIHPHPSYFEECLSTLEFVNRCRNVSNHPRVNHFVSIDAAVGGWAVLPSKTETTFGDFDQQPVHRLISTSSKLFWRQRTSIEFNIYEHADADVLEVSSYNIDARVELPHVYLAKSALLVAIEGLFYEKLEAIEQEEDALGIKHFNQDPVQLATLKDQMIGDYITRRTNLTALAEGQEGHFQLTIEPLELDRANDDGRSAIILLPKPQGVAPIKQELRVNAVENFDKKMNSFLRDDAQMRHEISKAINFEDITSRAISSAMIRLNSVRIEEEAQSSVGASGSTLAPAAPTSAKPSHTHVITGRTLHNVSKAGISAQKAIKASPSANPDSVALPPTDVAAKAQDDIVMTRSAAPTSKESQQRRHTVTLVPKSGGMKTKTEKNALNRPTIAKSDVSSRLPILSPQK